MGIIHHTAIVVTGADYDFGPVKERNKLSKAHEKAIEIFGKKTVTKLTGESINGTMSFMVAPNGSKLGWEPSNTYLENIEAFIEYLDSLKYDDGSTSVEYVKLSYGEFGLQAEDWRGHSYDSNDKKKDL